MGTAATHDYRTGCECAACQEFSNSWHQVHMICPQCEKPIDAMQPYSLGGEIGLLGGLTRPSHLGDCETMPPFIWAPAVRTPVFAIPAAWRDEIAQARSTAAKKAWATMRARRAA